MAQQNPEAIDAGAFHNDVVAVGSGTVLFCHERALVAQDAVLQTLRDRIGAGFATIIVTEREVSLERAVATYLFNSQLLARPDGGTGARLERTDGRPAAFRARGVRHRCCYRRRAACCAIRRSDAEPSPPRRVPLAGR